MIRIEIVADSKYPIDRKLVRSQLRKTLILQGINQDTHITVMIVGSRKMSSLNSQYMQRKEVTDVLSFPLNDPADDVPFVSSPDGVLRLGDIVVCYPVAMKSALKKQKLVDEIIVEYADHGLMHLLGIHHN